MDDATAEDWIAVAAGHASRPVTLNEGRNATVTAKRVFGVIFDRCEKDPYAVIDLIARDREVLEEAQRGQGRKLQHQLRPNRWMPPSLNWTRNRKASRRTCYLVLRWLIRSALGVRQQMSAPGRPGMSKAWFWGKIRWALFFASVWRSTNTLSSKRLRAPQCMYSPPCTTALGRRTVRDWGAVHVVHVVSTS